MQATDVVELAKKHQGRLKVVAIDGDESPDLTAELAVRGFPTFVPARFVWKKACPSRLV